MQGLKSSAAFVTGATRAPLPAQAKSPARGLITASALKVLERMPIGRSGCDAFRFQAPGRCLDNTREMMKASTDALARQGLARRDSPQGLVQRLRAALESDSRTIGSSLSAQEIGRLCAQHGPLQLVLHRLIPPGQGDDAYPRHHSVVALATFDDHEGRTIAVLLDGNDRQRNSVMDQLKAWMAGRADTRELGQLTQKDFAAFDASRRASGGLERVHQTAFRFVELEPLLASAKATPLTRYRSRDEDYTIVPDHPAMLILDRRVQTLQPLLSESDEFCLQTLVDQDPKLVERFAGAC